VGSELTFLYRLKQKDIVDFDLRSPLHYAAKEARLLAVSYLMGIASNPNVKDRYGNTALDFALQGGTLYHKCVLSEFKFFSRMYIFQRAHN
jgi:ankyrin repeat protein